MRVLVVEDNAKMAALIRRVLAAERIGVDVAPDGESGLALSLAGAYDVIVLDRMLPDVDGLAVLRRLRAGNVETPVLMLTALGSVEQRIGGLDAGADDYLPKPFAFPELAARVVALGRRGGPTVPPVLHRAGIRLDPHRREVYRDGRYVPLSRKEFAVLAELLRADGAAVSAEQLLEKAWDENADPFTNAVRIAILKLRRKLGNPAVILTEPGVGYRIP